MNPDQVNYSSVSPKLLAMSEGAECIHESACSLEHTATVMPIAASFNDLCMSAGSDYLDPAGLNNLTFHSGNNYRQAAISSRGMHIALVRLTETCITDEAQ
jgi:hypothetical protein